MLLPSNLLRGQGHCWRCNQGPIQPSNLSDTAAARSGRNEDTTAATHRCAQGVTHVGRRQDSCWR